MLQDMSALTLPLLLWSVASLLTATDHPAVSPSLPLLLSSLTMSPDLHSDVAIAAAVTTVAAKEFIPMQLPFVLSLQFLH